jgi:hypothetical protein
MLYLNGSITIADPCLTKLFLRGAGGVRGTVHWRILRTIADHLPDMTELHWARVRELWDVRLAATPQYDAQDELHWYGWLFELLPDSYEWSVRMLRSLLMRGIDTNHDSAVIAKLGRLAPAYPSVALDCLGLMAEADRDDRHVRGWGHDAEQVLVAARDAGDNELRSAVIKFVNQLGARGVLTFRHVLSEPSEQVPENTPETSIA